MFTISMTCTYLFEKKEGEEGSCITLLGEHDRMIATFEKQTMAAHTMTHLIYKARIDGWQFVYGKWACPFCGDILRTAQAQLYKSNETAKPRRPNPPRLPRLRTAKAKTSTAQRAETRKLERLQRLEAIMRIKERIVGAGDG